MYFEPIYEWGPECGFERLILSFNLTSGDEFYSSLLLSIFSVVLLRPEFLFENIMSSYEQSRFEESGASI